MYKLFTNSTESTFVHLGPYGLYSIFVSIEPNLNAKPLRSELWAHLLNVSLDRASLDFNILIKASPVQMSVLFSTSVLKINLKSKTKTVLFIVLWFLNFGFLINSRLKINLCFPYLKKKSYFCFIELFRQVLEISNKI